jgi:hypothetical protein
LFNNISGRLTPAGAFFQSALINRNYSLTRSVPSGSQCHAGFTKFTLSAKAFGEGGNGLNEKFSYQTSNFKRMKTLFRFLFFVACISLLATCTKSDRFGDDMPVAGLKYGQPLIIKGKPVMVTLPFEAHYLGNYVSMDPDARCGDPPNYRIIVEGPGNGTKVGKSIIHFDFCCNIDNGVYGNAQPSVNGKYFDYIVAANGDSLYIHIPAGRVIEGRLPYMPSYVIEYWKDPFEILGGSGRFKGATGGGMTDDYNSSLDNYSHHNWVGTMVKGKEDECIH